MKIRLLVLASAVLCASAQAAIVVDFSQVGDDVVVTTTGSVNTTDLTKTTGDTGSIYLLVAPTASRMAPQYGEAYDNYAGSMTLTGVLGTGEQLYHPGVAATGDHFEFEPNRIRLPLDYVSGTQIVGTMTFANETLTELGINTDFTATWGAGANQDSLSITVGAVPEPATAGLLAISSLILVGMRRIRMN